ncbi:serine hydrolase domain-containing protein [Comamonas badia]|uniref:serine hydrolase domain-containing protein n=1 Tax=Comamonas badia TaxID=265291 RepID=UPI000407C59C|nr:serine hydrolase domain-containing protein [Comamonas badia]
MKELDTPVYQTLTRRSVLGLATAGGLVLAGCGGGSGDAELPVQLQARLQQILDQNRALFSFPGAQAGIWTPQGSWVGVTGVAEQGGSRPPARADHTRIGSITKTFTVILILQLVDQGLIGLDDPIGKYVPGLPNGDTATIRMLASMTSGIPSYTFEPAFLDALFSNPQTVFTPHQLLDYVRGKPADFPADSQVAYSNTNTVALGIVVEQKTELPFAQALQQNILKPLELTQTLAPTSSDIPNPYWRGITTQGYPDGVVKDATDWNPSWGFSAGNMVSTLDDLRRWAVVLGTGGGIVSPAMQAIRMASMNSAVPPNSFARRYALGFGGFDGWIGHTGELPGFNTSILYDPKTATSMVAMVNSDIAAQVNGSSAEPAPTITSEFVAALGD